MERHIAKVTAIAVGASVIAGTFAFAAVGGMSMLGLSAPKSMHQIAADAAVVQEVPLAADAGALVPLTNAPLQALPSSSAAARAAAQQAAAIAATPMLQLVVPPLPIEPVTAPPPAMPANPATTAAPSTAAPTTGAPATVPKTVPPTIATVPPTVATVPKTTTTTRPAGVPADWPAGKPIPPMPANCSQPQLELSGVWNCDD